MTLTKAANREEEPVILGTTSGSQSMARDCSERASTKGAFPGRKRRLRYSLRSLLAATACLSAILAVCRWSYDNAVERHQHDLYWSSRLGQGWYLDWKQTAWGAVTCRDLARVERAICQSILSPRFEVKSSSLECLAHFSELRELRLLRVNVDDKAGRLLAQCKSLKKLDASYTNVTDGFVQQISALPLQRLYLSKTRVTAQSLATLARMPRLRSVRLNQLDLGEEALASLAAMRPDLQFDSDPSLIGSDWDWPIKSE